MNPTSPAATVLDGGTDSCPVRTGKPRARNVYVLVALIGPQP
jgi:hypothetical protein